MDEKIIYIKECAEIFNISASTLRKLIKKDLPYFRKGVKYCFYESQVRKYFEGKR